MAVTSIWAMSGRVDQVIEYARNPEKTRDSEIAASMHKVNNAIQYTTDELKTEAGDLIKLDSYIAQAKLLGREKIETQGQLTQYKKSVESEIDQLTQRRSELRNELKRVNRQENESRAASVKARISDISAKLKELRKEVVLCSNIAERSGCVLENLEQLKHQQETERKELIYHEHIRRGSRSGGQARSERR